MRIAYVGDCYNHGYSLTQFGTGFLIMTSRMKFIDRIYTYSPISNSGKEDIRIDKVRQMKFYDPDKILSIFSILSTLPKDVDLVILNLMPTAFGKKSASNVLGLIMPFLIKTLKNKKVMVIYHNSTITNDPARLGYNSFYDLIRTKILFHLEKLLFKKIDTVVLLKIYKKKIDQVIVANKVKFFDPRYIEGIPTLFLNDRQRMDVVENPHKNNKPRLLLHGNWGPQKDLNFALETLDKIRHKGLQFTVTLSGSINRHFPEYARNLKHLINKTQSIIDSYEGYVDEKDILSLFMSSDIVLMPYNSPGGHSGVLAIATLLNKTVISIRFPEFEEEAGNSKNIKLCSKGNFEMVIEEQISNIKQNSTANSQLQLDKKLRLVEENIANLFGSYLN